MPQMCQHHGVSNQEIQMKRRPDGTPSPEYFLNRSHTVPDAGCWLWDGCTGRTGYGQVRTQGKTVDAHRAAYTASHGVIPPGGVVRHSCDTPLCVNPDHLRIGTRVDNEQDKVSRGRSPKAKVTPEQVRAIRASPAKPHVIAELYGVQAEQVRRIRRRHAFRTLV